MKTLLNQITLKSTNKEIKNFIEKCFTYPLKFTDTDNTEEYFKTKGYFMHSIFPPPDSLLDKNYNSYGIEWCLLNWGTEDTLKQAEPFFKKFLDNYDDSKGEELSEFTFEFNTTKRFCTSWLKKASELFSDIEFKAFSRDDMNVTYSILDIKEGKIINANTYNDYSNYLYYYVYNTEKSLRDIIDETVDYFIGAFVNEENVLDLFNFEIFLFDDFIWAAVMSDNLGATIRQAIAETLESKNIKLVSDREEE